MSKIKKSLLSVVILIGVVLGALVVSGTLGWGTATGDQLGPEMVYPTPLPIADFTLTDQKNQPFTFSSTKGKVVLMTFLFTHCDDVCPYSAIKMRQAVKELGERGESVELVAISTDPERDSVEALAAYSREFGLFDRWHFVTGSMDQMQKLYKELKIAVIKTELEELEETAISAGKREIPLPVQGASDSPVNGLSEAQIADGSRIAQKYSGGYDIAHSAPFWVIDTEGRLRSSLDVSATPAQIAAAIKKYW